MIQYKVIDLCENCEHSLNINLNEGLRYCPIKNVWTDIIVEECDHVLNNKE
jgi:transcription elongation factor Elf1